ncbi:uncharacterized protein LOC127261849 [Andrographis paniculata]|uniref:uncharacterized protein LOC127261849 n=1 Tax=Andrographis paniculata TaxID=175694 RepID=UPI0021E7E829|nr:uncharacterized protein LOC127261849 [Andrographis paniculata]
MNDYSHCFTHYNSYLLPTSQTSYTSFSTQKKKHMTLFYPLLPSQSLYIFFLSVVAVVALSFLRKFEIDMSEGNMFAADCIVLCCCCQCLILQILIVLILKLPNKLVKKTKEYAKKFKARRRKTKTTRIMNTSVKSSVEIINKEDVYSLGNSFDSISISLDSLQFGSMDEIVKVLEELSGRGEFAFGSFWNGGDLSASQRLRSCPAEIDYGDVGIRLIELFGSASFSLPKN